MFMQVKKLLPTLFVVNFRYETIFRNNTKISCLFLAKGSPDNKEIGLEANESKQIQLQILINEFHEFYLLQNRLIKQS